MHRLGLDDVDDPMGEELGELAHLVEPLSEHHRKADGPRHLEVARQVLGAHGGLDPRRPELLERARQADGVPHGESLVWNFWWIIPLLWNEWFFHKWPFYVADGHE